MSDVHIRRGIDTLEEIWNVETKSMDVILTDPPYDFGEEVKRELHSNFLRIAKSAVIVFSPPENQWVLPADQYLFWKKPISTKNTSKSYGRFVEMVFLYGLDNYVWNTEYHWSNYVNTLNDRVMGHSDHPHEKPESMIKRFILLHTLTNDRVFDPFCGSGTIPIVANELGRVGIGWDLE